MELQVNVQPKKNGKHRQLVDCTCEYSGPYPLDIQFYRGRKKVQTKPRNYSQIFYDHRQWFGRQTYNTTWDTRKSTQITCKTITNYGSVAGLLTRDLLIGLSGKSSSSFYQSFVAQLQLA